MGLPYNEQSLNEQEQVFFRQLFVNFRIFEFLVDDGSNKFVEENERSIHKNDDKLYSLLKYLFI